MTHTSWDHGRVCGEVEESGRGNLLVPINKEKKPKKSRVCSCLHSLVLVWWQGDRDLTEHPPRPRARPEAFAERLER
jgi:hypothetical protein